MEMKHFQCSPILNSHQFSKDGPRDHLYILPEGPCTTYGENYSQRRSHHHPTPAKHDLSCGFPRGGGGVYSYIVTSLLVGVRGFRRWKMVRSDPSVVPNTTL